MSDLEITKLCAEASEVWKDADKWYPTLTLDATFKGIRVTDDAVYLEPNNPYRQDPQHYDPLHDDAQAMALVKKFGLHIDPNVSHTAWSVCWIARNNDETAIRPDLNRAICLCVANMQKAKHD